MSLSIKLWPIITSVVVGGLVGMLGGPAIMLVPWAIIALLIGMFSDSKKASLLNGAVYGFTLAYVFMVVGYNGSAPLTTKLMPFIIFGIVGALCGSVLALAAYVTRRLIRTRTGKTD